MSENSIFIPRKVPKVLFARKVAYAPAYSRNWHSIKEHQIFHILKGNMSLELESGLCYHAAPGDTLLLPANVRHLDRFHESQSPEMFHLRFHWEDAEHFFSMTRPDCIQYFSSSVRADIATVFQLLHLPRNRMDGGFNTPLQQHRISMQLGVILDICIEQFSVPFTDMPDYNAQRFNDACRFIEDKLESKLTLQTVAAHLRISPRTLSRLFSSFAGVSFHTYLLGRKMEKARVMLQAGDYSVSETAYASGFSDPGYFSKVFKKYFSLSPTEFC